MELENLGKRNQREKRMQQMSHRDLAKAIAQISYVHGSFRLRSGQISSHYLDKYQFESDPVLLRQVARSLVPLLPPEIDLLAGVELGGIPLATALSLEVGLPVVFVRKEPKSYGTQKQVEGGAVAGKRLCLIEDVITTGGQVIDSAEVLRQLGATVEDVLCVIWRGRPQEPRLEQARLHPHALFEEQELAVFGETL